MCSNLYWKKKLMLYPKHLFFNQRTAKKPCFSLIFRPMSGYFVIVSDHVSGLTPNYFEDVPRLILHTVI